MPFESLLSALFLLFLAALTVLDIHMFLSLGRQGDERRQMIVGRASGGAFFVAVAYLLFCVAENIYRGTVQGLPARELNPFIVLSVLAAVYSALLLYYKRKYSA